MALWSNSSKVLPSKVAELQASKTAFKKTMNLRFRLTIIDEQEQRTTSLAPAGNGSTIIFRRS